MPEWLETNLEWSQEESEKKDAATETRATEGVVIPIDAFSFN